ncbi:MAG: helix-hairpin-helix domain-containing protein [Lachnospiraceae bacterium]|nr:helix-hairpin-helix domain-containing protein [Lachnospiraceae bacterium]
MKLFHQKFVSAVLFLLLAASAAVLTGCGEQADEILSLPQQETASAGTQSALTADGQETAAEAENAGTVPEQGEADGLENDGSPEGQETGQAAENTGDSSDAAEAADGSMAVYICGAVNSPGVYEVTAAMRLVDAVELAGGFSQEADTTYWNLAGKLTDGAMYYIPTVSETAEESFSLRTGGEEAGGETSADDGAESGDSGAGNGSGTDDAQADSSGEDTSSDGLISINTATKEELTALPGIGDTKAAAIITYRETNGPFTAIDEIMNVTGIGESTYEKLKDYICL